MTVKDNDLKNALWIVAPKEIDAPVIMRSFVLEDFTKAEIFITALGFFKLYVNGKPVSDDCFVPSNSLFCKRNIKNIAYPIKDNFTYRCYYLVYDITSLLNKGENTVEIYLGNGWYRQQDRTSEGKMAFGDALGTCFSVKVKNGNKKFEICSDGTEKCRNTATIYNQLFYGEIYDARIDALKQYSYFPVKIISLPNTHLTRDFSKPDRVIKKIRPKLLYKEKNRKVYDVGINISGLVSIKTSAECGERVRIRFSENINGNKLDFESTGVYCMNDWGKNQYMEDVFIGDGNKHLYQPSFVWHGFRYFEILGNGEADMVSLIHADVSVTSEFESSSKELNWIFNAFLRTQLNNMHCSVPSDCPHRERLGYTGDGQACAPAAMLMLESKNFYRKWIRDIFDSQDRKTGHINHTAPFAGGGGGPGGWGCAAITVPYNFYKIFGDKEPLTEHYNQMKMWINYLEEHSENGLVVREERGGWCLGEWLTLEKTEIPEPFVNTCYLIKSLVYMEKIAKAINKSEDILYFKNLRKISEKAVIEKYYDNKTGSFALGVQGADAFAIFAGLGNKKTLNNLILKYNGLKHFDTGFLCTDILCEILFKNGEESLAFELLTSHNRGSFGFMMDRGATTLWEDWDGTASHDHPMFGACSRHFLTSVLGINQSEDSVGFKKIIISPKVPQKLLWAKGSIELKSGKIYVEWKQDKLKKEILFNIKLPNNLIAVFEFMGMKKKIKGEENITISLN